MKPKTKSDTALFAAMVAAKQGWKINPDADFTGSLEEGLTTNWNRYGYYLCPCRDSDGSHEADADLICPCKYSWKDIEEFGHCYCALYLSDSFAKSGASPEGIKDRRYSHP
jgi:ferredoxin-thioredoxin reductase catalytic subunit